MSDEPVFHEPWEAQAAALTVALYEGGAFSWPEWSACLAEETDKAQRAGDPDTGQSYYQHSLQALERLVAERRLTDAMTLERYRLAWQRAAERTPHGTPVELVPEDFG